MKIFLKELKLCRITLKQNRKKFWEDNKKNFEKNIKKIIKTQKLPKGWKVYFIATDFILDKKPMPYDSNGWSDVMLIAATKRQGFEIMVFFNKSKSFLSLPGLMHLVIHELAHVNQATKSPKKFIRGLIDDKSARDLEIGAEKQYRKIVPEEFRKQELLEKVLYCYDIGSWKSAKKMADFLYKKKAEIYSGGYIKGMTKEEYKVFLLAKENKNINIFIDSF